MTDKEFDTLLGIKTSGRIDTYEDVHHHRYEATPISVLDRIVEYIDKENVFVDVGCGKGRVDFYINYKTNCQCIGIEFQKEIYEIAMDNKEKACLEGVTFEHIDATRFKIDETMDRFYFFNPFSLVLFRRILNNILDSYYKHPRQILLFFYYPMDDYVNYLLNHDQLLCIDEIDMNDIFETSDIQERMLVFELM